jgi:hypothetical protein
MRSGVRSPSAPQICERLWRSRVPRVFTLVAGLKARDVAPPVCSRGGSIWCWDGAAPLCSRRGRPVAARHRSGTAASWLPRADVSAFHRVARLRSEGLRSTRQYATDPGRGPPWVGVGRRTCELSPVESESPRGGPRRTSSGWGGKAHLRALSGWWRATAREGAPGPPRAETTRGSRERVRADARDALERVGWEGAPASSLRWRARAREGAPGPARAETTRGGRERVRADARDAPRAHSASSGMISRGPTPLSSGTRSL